MFTLGFLHYAIGKGGNHIVSFTNYGDVGFSMDNGHQARAIDAPWSLWRPKMEWCGFPYIAISPWVVHDVIIGA